MTGELLIRKNKREAVSFGEIIVDEIDKQTIDLLFDKKMEVVFKMNIGYDFTKIYEKRSTRQ